MRQPSAPSVTKTVDGPFFFLKTKLFVTARKPAAMCRPKEAAVRGSQTIERRVFMSDTDIMASYQNHQKALAEANVINKSAVFDALATAKIATVNVTFDGEGDSGQIEGIAADDSPNIPQVSIQLLRETGWGTGGLDSIQSPLRGAIEQLCYDFLEQEHGGWENNDGAFGEFTFDVATREIRVEFNGRFSDSTLFNHTF
jgi:hypothetical protein